MSHLSVNSITYVGMDFGCIVAAVWPEGDRIYRHEV